MSGEDNRSTDEVKSEQVRRWARKVRCLYDRREKGYCRADEGRWKSLRGVEERKVTMVTRKRSLEGEKERQNVPKQDSGGHCDRKLKIDIMM